ncbi:MAG: C1 family peptidase [Tatlockia sp.]|nr:C1 family peptidase [Tatlockia sp.]
MKLKYFTFFAAFCTNLYAEEIKLVGTLSTPLKLPSSALINSQAVLKNIELLKIELSSQAQQNLRARAENALSRTKQFALSSIPSPYPSKISLGMNKVPVLNQGQHGTCVTFAVTAAFDAILNKGDYLSQVCQLQLGNYLEKNSYSLSGWNGSFGTTVLSQSEMFGVVPKIKEQAGCGGLTSYPLVSTEEIKGMMPLEEYHQISEDLNHHINWSTLLDHNQAFADRINTNHILQEIKASLNQGDRVTFGVLLADYELGAVGAVGKHHVQNDSWVLTSEIARDVFINPKFGGHEMIITGYDDDAIALDDHNYEHRGLLTLRNSWSDKAGDDGDFYMSYDYFKLLVMEAARIRDASEKEEKN